MSSSEEPSGIFLIVEANVERGQLNEEPSLSVGLIENTSIDLKFLGYIPRREKILVTQG